MSYFPHLNMKFMDQLASDQVNDDIDDEKTLMNRSVLSSDYSQRISKIVQEESIHQAAEFQQN